MMYDTGTTHKIYFTGKGLSKQQEIREEVAKTIAQCNINYDLEEENRFREITDKVLFYLQSQGCVLKVDKEMPDSGLYLQVEPIMGEK